MGKVMVLGVWVLVLVLYIHPMLSFLSARGEAAKRGAAVVALEKEHQRLERRAKALQDPRALEREARRLGMVRPGERGYVVSNLPSE